LELNQDIFKFENHFDNWLKGSDYPIMFVRYEAIWENLDKILEYSEVPNDYWETFPEKKQRESKVSSLPKQFQQGIKEIYSDFSERVEKIDDVFVVKPKWYKHRILNRIRRLFQ
jgi:NDP-sugar pyrophosphorylase family protein